MTLPPRAPINCAQSLGDHWDLLSPCPMHGEIVRAQSYSRPCAGDHSFSEFRRPIATSCPLYSFCPVFDTVPWASEGSFRSKHSTVTYSLSSDWFWVYVNCPLPPCLTSKGSQSSVLPALPAAARFSQAIPPLVCSCCWQISTALEPPTLRGLQCNLGFTSTDSELPCRDSTSTSPASAALLSLRGRFHNPFTSVFFMTLKTEAQG